MCPKRLHQLAETIGTARLFQAPWGSGPSSWMLPRTMSRMCPKVCWLPCMIQDTEPEEAAFDEDFLLARAVTTGWKYHEERVRDIDELVEAAVEPVEDDVTDEEMLIDLIQMMRDVFDQAGAPCPPGISVECGMDNGVLS